MYSSGKKIELTFLQSLMILFFIFFFWFNKQTVAQNELSFFEKSIETSNIRILSKPDSAVVYLNKKRIGITPILFKITKGDTFSIIVSKRFYKNWHTQIIKNFNNTLCLNPILERESAYITILSDHNSKIYIDDTLRSISNLYAFEVNEGQHRIIVTDSIQSRSVEQAFTIHPSEKKAFISKIGYVSALRVTKAFIIPGYAQLSDKAYLKGSAFLLGGVASAAFIWLSINNYNNSLNVYNNSVKEYKDAETEADAIILRNEMERKHDKLNKAFRLRTAAFTSLSVIYVASIVDAILHHLISDEISLVVSKVPPVQKQVFNLSGITYNAKFRIAL